MWSKSYLVVTKEVTKEQMWKLFSNVDSWPSWDAGVEQAKLHGKFETGGSFLFQPKGGPKLTLGITEATENSSFTDCTSFPLVKMYGEHLFEDTDGGLKLTTTMTVKGPLAFLWRRLVAQKIVDTLPEDMQVQISAAKKL